MDNLSEVLKILEGALNHNVRKAADYAGLLADKLEGQGETRQASMIRQKLARVPQETLSPASFAYNLPVDSESQQSTIDEEQPRPGSIELILSNNAKSRIEEFIASVRASEKLVAAGLRPSTRLLLYGPPGCGKTQAAKLVSAELGLPLLTVRCDSLVSSLLGQTSRNLRRVFEHAEGRPCVLFLDEFDALAKTRSDEREIGELQRVVIALLQNIDALSDETVLIAATNHEELLDRAVWRRFAWHVPIPLPDMALRERIWDLKLGDRAPNGVSIELLASLSEGLSGAGIEHVAHDAIRAAILRGDAKADNVDLLRRLGLTVALAHGYRFESRESEIAYLREWAPRPLTLRKLASYYDVSVRQIRKAAQGEDYGQGYRTSNSPS